MTAPLAASRGPKWGTSLITFFHPTFFGLPAETSYPAYVEAAYADPRAYFDRMLDASRDAGLAGVELAPVPAGYEGALKAYGSVAGVQAACADRGLRIASSYMEGGHLIRPGLQDGQGRAEAAALVDEHARFLAGVGCELIVMGTLPRLEFGDAAYGDVPPDIHEKVADELNRLGSIAQRHGCKIALHTDAYSLFSRDADIDRMMELTDPDCIAMCLDSGHVTLDGGDAVAILERHLDRIPVAHWKDADAPLDGRTLKGDFLERHEVMMSHFRWVGEGIVDWDRFMDIVGRAGWDGWAHAEFDFAEDPVSVLRAHVDICRGRMAERVAG
jgi:inosose dehydratase